MMRANVLRVVLWLVLVVGLVAGTTAFVACGDDPKPTLPPYDEELSTFSGIGGLPSGGAGAIPSGDEQQQESDAGQPDASTSDTGEIDLFPDGG